MSDLQKKITQSAKNHYDYMVQTRRYLHKNPEVSFREYETTEYIEHELKKLNIRVERPLETGCVGILEGKPSDRVIALRADIDALAMDEEGEAKREFLSERPGAAHCCGHDAHTANMLGVANILTDLKDQLEGKVLLIFQPAEEKLPGGGRLLTESGFLQEQGIQEIYGLHMDPVYDTGQIAVKPGAFMARPDEFEIEIIGKGGHAAAPQKAVDPIVMAGQIITQFQTIVSRSLDPAEPAVVTIGKVWGGTAHNVIPAKVNMIGTVRTFSKETADRIKARMDQILKGITEGAGGSYRFEFNEGYPAVMNDEGCTEKLVAAAEQVIGRENIVEMEKPLMAGEDFAFYQQEFPGAFFFLGTGSDEADSRWSWHHPKYNIDEKAFLTGSALMAGLVLGEG